MHLHNHSNYSVIDGRALIKDYLDLALADGQEAFALTDHGTLGGAIEFYTAAKKLHSDSGKTVKPIIGCELYVDAYELRERPYPGHLTVLAKNEDGYRALIAANNLAHRQFYYRPRITLQQIIDKQFAKDWIILSGCQSSPIYDYPQSEAAQIVKQLVANSGNFFLEFMKHESKDEQFEVKQTNYLERVSDLHKTLGLPVVITNDCHYAHKHHEDIHQQLLSQSKEPSDLEFDGTGFHFKTIEQMQKIASDLGANNAVDNAVEIGKLCNLVIPEADDIKWYVPDITGGYARSKIIQLCEARLSAEGFQQEYWDRYSYELSVLATSTAILNSYLVAYDVIYWCVERNIPAAARGSMAGSLISFLLGITQEDPIKYRLSFSRAVNPARPTIPDFDLDVSSVHRAEILDYLKERYENNIPIAAYTHYGPKGALRKILKMEGLREFKDINELTKPLPDDWADGDFEYSPTAKRNIGKVPWTETVPEQYIDFLAIYQGLYSTMSVHPSGVLVGGPERELEHEVPLQWIASSKTLTSAFDMYTLKKIGLFKLDVLGLRTLDQLSYMEKVSGDKLPDDNYDDQEVLMKFGWINEDLSYHEGLLAEIFQMDGYACREVLRNIGGIWAFEDIIAANTLARPGCAQFTPLYRSGYEGLLHEYPTLREILEPTNGLILYQEQVMEIARILADFDDAEQDEVKEAIKYFRHEVWSKTIEPLFRSRCAAKGIDATHMLEAIAKMASYTYNRAHAMTYAAIAYKMMWYKCYHPAAFYAAVYDAAEDKQRLILESHFFKVKWLPADINYSESDTIVRDNQIILGLSAIKGVGPAAFAAIEKVRPFTSVEDFVTRVEKKKCNSAVVKKLEAAFAFSSLGKSGSYAAFQESFGFNLRYLDNALVTRLEKFNNRNNLAGFITDVRPTKIAKAGPNHGKDMAQVFITNSKGRTRCVVFPDVWAKAKGNLYTGKPIVLEGEYQVSGDFIVSGGNDIE